MGYQRTTAFQQQETLQYRCDIYYADAVRLLISVLGRDVLYLCSKKNRDLAFFISAFAWFLYLSNTTVPPSFLTK